MGTMEISKFDNTYPQKSYTDWCKRFAGDVGKPSSYLPLEIKNNQCCDQYVAAKKEGEKSNFHATAN